MRQRDADAGHIQLTTENEIIVTAGAVRVVTEVDDVGEVFSEDGSPFSMAVVPREQNPVLIYVGGLDEASQPTMASTARLVVDTLTSGRIMDPESFPWHRLTYGIVKRLRSRLRAKGLAPRTVNKALTLVRAVAREAWIMKSMSRDEYDRIGEVENLKSMRLPAGRVVEQDEIAKILLACDDTDMGFRDAGFIALMRGAGLREKEATMVERADYDLGSGTIRVLHGKQHKQRESYVEPVFDVLLRRILERLPDAPPEAPLLPRLAPAGTFLLPLQPVTTQAVHKLLNARALRAGVAACTPHDLRRSFITFQLEQGVDPLRLARAVGHADPRTTSIYDRRTTDSDRRAIRNETAAPEVTEREVYFQAVAANGFRPQEIT